jgi:hypothetical protein
MTASNSQVNPHWFHLHDRMNLALLPWICLLDLIYLASRNEAHYFYLYAIFTSYITIDTLWLVFIPSSVSSPNFILFHHIICLLAWQVPYFVDRAYAVPASISLLVEINTFLLILKRNGPFNSTISSVIEFSFNLTWVVSRILLYPVILIISMPTVMETCRLKNSLINHGVALVCVLVALIALNTKWTIDWLRKLTKGKNFVADKDRGL